MKRPSPGPAALVVVSPDPPGGVHVGTDHIEDALSRLAAGWVGPVFRLGAHDGFGFGMGPREAADALADALDDARAGEVLVCGHGTDYGVLRVALDLDSRGFAVKVAADACASPRGWDHHEWALRLLALHLGTAAISGVLASAADEAGP